jgi:redox-regulated HSP33 family molecular chaperone
MNLLDTPMDVLFRFSFADLPIRGQWVRLQSSLHAAGQFRAYPPQASNLLGQMLASVAMIADNLKFLRRCRVTVSGKRRVTPLLGGVS